MRAIFMLVSDDTARFQWGEVVFSLLLHDKTVTLIIVWRLEWDDCGVPFQSTELWVLFRLCAVSLFHCYRWHRIKLQEMLTMGCRHCGALCHPVLTACFALLKLYVEILVRQSGCVVGTLPARDATLDLQSSGQHLCVCLDATDFLKSPIGLGYGSYPACAHTALLSAHHWLSCTGRMWILGEAVIYSRTCCCSGLLCVWFCIMIVKLFLLFFSHWHIQWINARLLMQSRVLEIRNFLVLQKEFIYFLFLQLCLQKNPLQSHLLLILSEAVLSPVLLSALPAAVFLEGSRCLWGGRGGGGEYSGLQTRFFFF